MTLRARLTVLAAAAVAVAIALAAAAAWLVTRAELRHQVDASLERAARRSTDLLGAAGRGRPPDQVGELLRAAARQAQARAFLGPRPPSPVESQLLAADGAALPLDSATTLPPAAADLRVARGELGRAVHDLGSGGGHYRVLTVPLPGAPGYAVQLARPLTEEDGVLRRLALVLGLVAIAGVAGSAAAGWAVARAGLAPVDRLTGTVEHVARTQELRTPIEVRGRDEIARLARSFNAMLTALDDARRRQRQLIADASHELRTPLTSLRTNIELLARSDGDPRRTLEPADRAALLGDLTAQLGELTGLVGDLIALARDEVAEEAPLELDLAELVGRAVERARLRAPRLRFELDLAPCRIVGRPAQLERAVTNLLDNAVKWSQDGSTVEVTARGCDLTVRDHGPGIADEDLPYVFDRFYRAPAARHLPGSGLGLAIVRDAAEAHGGSVAAERAAGGGTVVRLHLPA